MDNRQNRRQQAKARARHVADHMRAARKSMGEGDTVAAERSCLTALDVDPLAADPHHLLAHIAYSQGRLQNAADHILEAATRDDSNLDIHADCGAIMNMLGRAAEAEAACRHVVEHRPDHVGAWNNLAVALDIQGRWDEAQKACDEALQRRPDYADALINKGSLLVKSDQPVAAIEALSEAVRLAPENPLAKVNLAGALKAVGEYDLALAQCQSAIEIKPDYPEAHGAMGDVLAAAGEFAGALAAYDHALEHRPGFMAVRLNRAAALHKLDRLDEAAAAYRSILADFDESADAHAGLGVVNLAAGDLREAVAAFRQAVTVDPGHGRAWAALAAAPGEQFDEADLVQLEALCSDARTPTESRIAAHFALADSLDKLQRYDDAFDHYSAGNAMRKALLEARDQVFDGDELMDEVAAVIADWPASLAAAPEASADERPVFVVGMPRSGTTLVEQILASHPDVAGVGEIGSLSAFDPEVGAAAGAQAVLARLAAHAGEARRIVDKTPFQFRDIGMIRHLFPAARIIHCRRDPLDTGLSCFMQNFVDAYPWSCDLSHIGVFINAYRQLMAHWQDISGDALIDVSYESLIGDPEPEIRRLISAVGLDWDSACLRFHETRRVVHSASNWQVRQPLYAGALDRSQNYAPHLAPLRQALA